jgi:murein DD-endopeptidase MepM/ murein hydrolase activator NlpD
MPLDHRRRRHAGVAHRPRTVGAAGAALLAVLAGCAVQASVSGPGTPVAASPADPARADARADRDGDRPDLTAQLTQAAELAQLREEARLAAEEQAAADAAARRKAAAAERKAKASGATAAEDKATAAAVARVTADADARAAAARRAEAASRRVLATLAAARTAALGPVRLPVAGYTLTSRFGDAGAHWANVHTGLDFACPAGTFVHAVAAGTVTSAGWAGDYGNRVIVTHADGAQTWYAHQFAIVVREGQAVSAGQVLGVVGSTGNATGPHLHLEVRVSGSAVDPAAWLLRQGLSA